MKNDYTYEELADMKRHLEQSIAQTERQHPEARPLPPLREDEAKDLLLALSDTAATRLLTDAECFLIGQLVACYRQAIEARMLLGRNGRYFVISQADLEKLTGRNAHA